MDAELERSRLWFRVSLVLNAGLLIVFKYANFTVESWNAMGLWTTGSWTKIALPIGISFFTFQSLSYTIDVYRRKLEPTQDIIAFGAFVAFFPQLVAGPIERAKHLLPQFYKKRTFDYSKAIDGMRQILWGLFKKIVIADNSAEFANPIFNNSADMNGSTLVLGAIFFTFQIYGDFSGYSDIAIGTSRLFGFNLMQNFNFPYFSRDIAEFWRRWHISLSSWFRDYLYISLGGNRVGKYRTYANLLIVFFLTGLWHGASWNFVIWGLFHGFFIIIERLNIIKLPSKLKGLSRVYTLLVVIIGWVFFRAENLEYGIDFIGKMFSFTSGSNNYPYIFINNYVLAALAVGIAFSLPLRKFITRKIKVLITNKVTRNVVKYSFYIIIFIISLTELAQNTYNPFIYFRF